MLDIFFRYSNDTVVGSLLTDSIMSVTAAISLVRLRTSHWKVLDANKEISA